MRNIWGRERKRTIIEEGSDRTGTLDTLIVFQKIYDDEENGIILIKIYFRIFSIFPIISCREISNIKRNVKLLTSMKECSVAEMTFNTNYKFVTNWSVK